ncbi:hypothetical protein M422DRAFT_52192 [Sphaerobolus stellatus SS14]|uniref:Uncharacterized protein n=1 Tax=Sphaerobolus stellatus (strain SS14) TaxID=990650 RepID=A0A0C9TUF5_SPHS4|nr:hypothetical protein M422DRAFT_52192 [Sphaerobolus stellatus SS14]
MSGHAGKVAPPKDKFEFRFANLTPEEARGDKTDKSSKIHWHLLDLTPDQRASVEALHGNISEAGICGKIEDYVYSAVNPIQQNEAIAFLEGHSLNSASLEEVGNRWSVKWSRYSKNGQKRALYQCDCGREHTQFGSKKRHTAVDYTGCLAHAEITTHEPTGAILRARGFFMHNEDCKKAALARAPKLPLHPSVYAKALVQLQEGALLSAIQATNRELFRIGAYAGQPKDLRTSNFRWILKPSSALTQTKLRTSTSTPG